MYDFYNTQGFLRSVSNEENAVELALDYYEVSTLITVHYDGKAENILNFLRGYGYNI